MNSIYLIIFSQDYETSKLMDNNWTVKWNMHLMAYVVLKGPWKGLPLKAHLFFALVFYLINVGIKV